MAAEVERYFKSCEECAVSTTLRQLPAGKLHPLPVPVRPWLYIAVGFVPDLPSNVDNLVIPHYCNSNCASGRRITMACQRTVGHNSPHGYGEHSLPD